MDLENLKKSAKNLLDKIQEIYDGDRDDSDALDEIIEQVDSFREYLDKF